MFRLLALLIIGSFVVPITAEAQRRRRRAPAAQAEEPSGPIPTVADLDEIVPRLASANPDEVREAIDLLSVIDQPEVVPHIAGVLRSGRADPVTDRALEALRGLAHASSIEVLIEFSNHRRPSARRRAFLALAAIDDPRIPALLENGLRDSDRSVRGAAALALGNLDASSSLDTLFRAFERGVVEAAIAIGKIGDVAAVGRFDAHLGQRPLGVMLSGYDQFLRRDDISAEAKRDIVERLGEVAGTMVRRFLNDYLRTFSDRDQSPLRRLVDETIRRIPDAPAGQTLGGGE